MTAPAAGAPARIADAATGASWCRTAAWYRAPGAAALGCAFGVAFGRVDLVLLVAPLAIGWALALSRRTGRIPRAVADIASDSAVATRVTDTADVELVSVRQPDDAGAAMGAAVTVAGGRDRIVVTPFDAGTWGERSLARPDSVGAGPDGLYRAGPVRRAATVTGLVLPEVSQVSALVWPPIQGGWTGAHLSRRPGQGSDLVDLREFTPGTGCGPSTGGRTRGTPVYTPAVPSPTPMPRSWSASISRRWCYRIPAVSGPGRPECSRHISPPGSAAPGTGAWPGGIRPRGVNCAGPDARRARQAPTAPSLPPRRSPPPTCRRETGWA